MFGYGTPKSTTVVAYTSVSSRSAVSEPSVTLACPSVDVRGSLVSYQLVTNMEMYNVHGESPGHKRTIQG